MADEIISRAEARTSGFARYFTGKSCKNGHICERKTSDGHCCLCNIDRGRSAKRRERHRDNMKAWRERNPEKQREIAKRCTEKYRLRDLEKNREYHRAYQVEWVKGNLERKRELGRTWRKRNPEATRAIKSRRRAKEISATGSHTADDLKDILRLQRGRCAYCRSKFGKQLKPSLDHIQPLSRGGSNDRKNLQFLCGSCNSSKHAKDPVEFSRRVGMLV